MKLIENGIVRNALFALGLIGAGCSGNSQSNLNNYTETLSIQFNQMYSGYDGIHMYQIPATVDGNVSNVKWVSSDPSVVDIALQPDGITAMITTKKAGSVTITATTTTGIGKAPLVIEQFTPDQWNAGQARYTSGSMVNIGHGINGTGGDVACTSCHGSTAVEHTPQQTGGFTDDQLVAIFEHGTLPPQDAVNPFFGGAAQFMMFHNWTMSSDAEAKGVIAYLRSLAPMPQGSIDFGGHGRPDGGYPMRDGGFGFRDGGPQGFGDGGHHHATDM